MTRVYLADAKTDERSALRLLLVDLNMDMAGEAADWLTTLAQAPISRTEMLLVDWDLLPMPRKRLLKNSARPAQRRWSSSSSAIWMHENKLRSPPAPMRLSAKVRCLNA